MRFQDRDLLCKDVSQTHLNPGNLYICSTRFGYLNYVMRSSLGSEDADVPNSHCKTFKINAYSDVTKLFKATVDLYQLFVQERLEIRGNSLSGRINIV